MRARLSETVCDIVYTSVYDGLVNASYASPASIRKAIAHERRNSKRSALITGLERELRRRAKKRSAK